MKKLFLMFCSLVVIFLFLVSCAPQPSEQELQQLDEQLKSMPEEELKSIAEESKEGRALAGQAVNKFNLPYPIVKERAKTIYGEKLKMYGCTDSDGGKDYLTAGNAYAKKQGYVGNHEDYCSGTVLSEGFCNENEYDAFEEYDCTSIGANYVCKERACKAGICPGGIIGWWPGNGGPGDFKGKINGKIIPKVSFNPGKAGQAFSFDNKQKGYVQIPNSDVLNFAPTDIFSIEVWIKTSAEGIIISKMGAPANPILVSGYELSVDKNGAIKMKLASLVNSAYAATEETSTSSSNYNDDKWHHIAVVSKPNQGCLSSASSVDTLAIYVDGALNSGKPTGFTCLDLKNTAPLKIGSGAGSSFKGQIDEVVIYNRALTAGEIKEHAEMGTICK
ncbi:MAG: LamG domain-containing protein [Nanoarchaeota archaeon]